MRSMPAYSYGASGMDMQMAESQLRANAQKRLHKDRVKHKQDDEDAILALLLH